ncbi:acetyl-coenzym A synthetase, mitochondrial [Pelomyxa schiedti]|nr:acetyl-coenzym A synthetase, mitochondrial [Pelomyxa schiedti]
MEELFSARHIAVIGAGTKPGTIGNLVVQNLLDTFSGKIYPINSNAPEVLGLKAYANIGLVPEEQIDVAVYTVPAAAVVSCARQAATKKVKCHIVITSGFSETGNKAAEDELVQIAKASGGRVVGPNVVGVLVNGPKGPFPSDSDPHAKRTASNRQVNASFAPFLPWPGSTAMVSQSGALIIALIGTTHLRKFGCSCMVSLGNMSDVNFSDCIRHLSLEPASHCIALYMEGLHNGRSFIQAARECEKPIAVLKSGVSAHGAAAAASHTGSLAGSAKVYDAAFRQARVVKANDLEELLVVAQALSLQPPMLGDNVIVITNGGGIGVLSTDSAEFAGIPLRSAPDDLQAELFKCMPSFGSPKNPVDITGGSGAKGYEDSIEIALKHPWVHGVAVLYCETAVTNPTQIAQAIERGVNKAHAADPLSKVKPVVGCFVGGNLCVEGAFYLAERSIPVYTDPKSTMNALGALRQHGKHRELSRLHPEKPFTCPFNDTAPARQRAMEIIESVRAAGRKAMTEIEAHGIFTAYGLPVPKIRLAKSEEEAVALAQEIGYPVVLKIVSPQILHKSDAGGVKVNLRDAEAVRGAFTTIINNAKVYKADAEIHGVLVCEMAQKGMEVIVGSVNDSTFGPTIMFGMGGVFVEILKDVTFRIAPVSQSEVSSMLEEIRCYKILTGVRGEAPRDIAALTWVISRMSQLVYELAAEVEEVDANPVLVYEVGSGLKVVDARIILKSKTPTTTTTPHGH